jgi:hypothetical protein
VTATDIEEPVYAMRITADVPHSDFGEHAKKRIDYHFHRHRQSPSLVVRHHEAVRVALAHVTHPTNGGARGLRQSCGALTNLRRRREMQCGGALAGREQQFERRRERYFDSLPTTLRLSRIAQKHAPQSAAIGIQKFERHNTVAAVTWN